MRLDHLFTMAVAAMMFVGGSGVIPARAQGSLPRSLTCAGYRIVTDRPGHVVAPQGSPTRLRILRGAQIVWASPGDETVIEDVRCEDVTGDRVPEVIMTQYSGGAHCCTSIYVLALKPSVRLLLNYEAGHAGGIEIRDLDRDRRPELILYDDSFAYFDDLCFACSPAGIPLIACFRDGRFVDCTRSFPDVLRREIASWSETLRKAAEEGPRDAAALMYMRGTALGLYANYVLLGADEHGWEAVHALAPYPAVTSWLGTHRETVRRWAATRAKKLAVP